MPISVRTESRQAASKRVGRYASGTPPPPNVPSAGISHPQVPPPAWPACPMPGLHFPTGYPVARICRPLYQVIRPARNGALKSPNPSSEASCGLSRQEAAAPAGVPLPGSSAHPLFWSCTFMTIGGFQCHAPPASLWLRRDEALQNHNVGLNDAEDWVLGSCAHTVLLCSVGNDCRVQPETVPRTVREDWPGMTSGTGEWHVTMFPRAEFWAFFCKGPPHSS